LCFLMVELFFSCYIFLAKKNKKQIQKHLQVFNRKY